MARMNGCNYEHDNQAKPQAKGRMDTGSFARNSMGKGGVNGQLGGTDAPGKKMGLKAGENGTGKHKQDKR